MPIYEFYSPDTNKVYSFFARSLAQGQKLPQCPDQPGAKMERMLSRFSVTGRTATQSATAPDSNDPRMENMMAEMEQEMSVLDEKNPDPKVFGRMMRKMTEATGQAMPKEMAQMIRRLEAGEDPEKLEGEFGEVLGDMDFPEEDQSANSGSSHPRFRQPIRDSTLYEMADFL